MILYRDEFAAFSNFQTTSFFGERSQHSSVTVHNRAPIQQSVKTDGTTQQDGVIVYSLDVWLDMKELLATALYFGAVLPLVQ